MLALVSNKEKEENCINQTKSATKILKLEYRKRKFKARFKDEDYPQVRKPTPIDESDLSLCVLMWQSTIIQALYDLSNTAKNAEAKILRAEANSWFFGDSKNCPSPDFELVCELAALSQAKVLRMARIVLKQGEKALEGFNFRSIRKDYSTRIPAPRQLNKRKKSGE